jgi:hypothetical protein
MTGADRVSIGKKSSARVSQSVAAVAPVEEEPAAQLVFNGVNVARHRCVFRAELLGCSRERPRPCNCEKAAEVVPILSWLSVCHHLLLINAQRSRIWCPSLNRASP